VQGVRDGFVGAYFAGGDLFEEGVDALVGRGLVVVRRWWGMGKIPLDML
jgi:hypothetical protein